MSGAASPSYVGRCRSARRDCAICARRNDPGQGQQKTFDSCLNPAYVRNAAAGPRVRPAFINPNEEIMGSTPYGSADPISAFGSGLPPHIEIGRAGGSRASVGGQA